MRQLILFTAAYLVVLPNAYGDSAVVVSDAITFSGESVFPGGEVSFGLPVTADNMQGGTAVRMNYDYDGTSITLTGSNYTLDEGSSWFFLRAGDALTPGKIAAGEYDLIVGHREATFGTLDTFAVSFVPSGLEFFYLGVSRVAYDIDHADVERSDFGWVKLRLVNPHIPQGTTLQYVESVVAYNSPGIIVGTTQVVPEPTTLVLLFLSCASISQFRRRRMIFN